MDSNLKCWPSGAMLLDKDRRGIPYHWESDREPPWRKVLRENTTMNEDFSVRLNTPRRGREGCVSGPTATCLPVVRRTVTLRTSRGAVLWSSVASISTLWRYTPSRSGRVAVST